MENKKYWLNKSMITNEGGVNKQLINGEVVPDNIISRWANQKTKSGRTELEARLTAKFIVDDKSKLDGIPNPSVPSTTEKRGEALSEPTQNKAEAKAEDEAKQTNNQVGKKA